MPRLKPIEPARSEGRVKEVFEGTLKGKHFNIFRSMANSPAALDYYLAGAGALSRASLTAQEREAIALAIGEANNCEYCVAAHTALGKLAGLTDAQTVAARRGTFGDNAKLDALVKFALRIHEKRGSVSDQDVEAFRKAGYSDAHIAEVVAEYAHTIYTNYFNHVNGTVLDFPAVPPIK